MSLADQMRADVAIFLNTDEMAESLSYVPARGTDSVAFVGVFDLLDGPITDPSEGKRTVYRASCQCASDVPIKSEDSIQALGVSWQVTSALAGQYGMRTIHCEYVIVGHRKPKGAM
jgi:hypothetical protein